MVSTQETETIIESVKVIVKVWKSENAKGVTVDVICLPGYSYWKCPDSLTLRGLVDKALADTEYKRNGERREGDAFPGWRFYYPIS